MGRELSSYQKYELGSPASAVHANFGALYPSNVRGLLASQQPAEAAAEFRKVEDHAGVMINDPIGVMARLQLARSYSLLKDTAKAKSAYDDFFTLWKDADPGRAFLKLGKTEYSKLQ